MGGCYLRSSCNGYWLGPVGFLNSSLEFLY